MASSTSSRAEGAILFDVNGPYGRGQGGPGGWWILPEPGIELPGSWLWYVDVEARAIAVSRLEGATYVEVAVHGEDEKVRLEPYPAAEIDLALWWESGAP